MTDRLHPADQRPEDWASEHKRLDALRRLDLLDTPVEERFERITRMVCRLLNVPIAAFTLIDESRQWCKSVQGVDVVETSRSISFCSHAIQQYGTFTVTDARIDSRFFDNPQVTGEPHIVFYAGYPIKTSSGEPVGVLCAIDRKPREFSKAQQILLQQMAAMVEAELRIVELANIQRQLIHDLATRERQALIDPLTRLWNRNGIMEILHREWSEAARSNVTMGVIVAEISNLEAIIETYGSEAGDLVTREIARRFISVARTQHAYGRADSEVFVAVLPRCLAEQLPDIVAGMQTALHGVPVMLNEVVSVPVKVCIGGVTAIPSDGDRIEDVINEASRAMICGVPAVRDRASTNRATPDRLLMAA